ncbi:MAG TPA: TOMM precursor leader peptide-binding protein, partial [Cyanophyceae cyanobacterium]
MQFFTYYLLMIGQPRFKPCFRWEIVPSEGVFLMSEKQHVLLRGESYIQLAPLLNGQHRIDEIILLLQNQLSPLEVFYLLDDLRRQGYVVDSDSSISSEQAAFWGMLDTTPKMALKRLQNVIVSVVTFGDIDPTPFKLLLESLGIRVGEKGDRTVVLTDDYLQVGLDAFNQDAQRHGNSWMLVKPVGIEIWVGPIFIPNQTGCWECLKHRVQGHRKVERHLQKKKNTTQPFSTSLSVLPSTLQMALGLAATETAKWVIGDTNPTLEGNILTFNTLSLEKHNHVLVRRPQCSCCGDFKAVSTQQLVPIILQNQKKNFTSDGGHRSCSPDETFQRLAHHISPITGIASALQRNTLGGNETVPTHSYLTDHNAVLADDSLYFLRDSLRGRSGGKGKRDIQAKASALCESIERYAAVFQGDEARIQARFSELDNAILPNDCILFSDRQFAQREQWNAGGSRFNWVPEPFDDTLEIEWSPVWSLTHHRHCYVPMSHCYYGYSPPSGIQIARADGNGCAAGNNKEEAILQGFMELVERDSAALWWYNRLKKPAVDLSSFDEPYFQELLSYYQTIHRDLWVLDITSDFNIPAFVAISRRTDQEVENIIFGFGAHFDPNIGILRALTELNQLLPVVFHGTPDSSRGYEPEVMAWWQTATIEN